MRQHSTWAGIIAIGLASGLALSAPANAQRGDSGMSGGGAPAAGPVGGGGGGGGIGPGGGGGGRGGGGGIAPGGGGSPGIQPGMRPGGAPGMRGGIEPRIRSGAIDRRGMGGAPALTVRPGVRYGAYDRYNRNYYYNDGGRWSDSGWFPGMLLAAPFLLPWYLFGGGASAASQPAVYAGNYCATPQRVCLLVEPGVVDTGCSCRAPSGRGRFRGIVVP